MWPSQAQDDGEDLLRAYLLAVEDYAVGDVEAAVDELVKGTAPGVSPSFRPKPSETGAECRRQMNLRLESEARARRPALPPPDVVRSPESRARVAAMAQRAIEDIASTMLTPDAETSRRRQRFNERMQVRFDPKTEREALARLGYSVGDPDGEDGTMGGEYAA